MSIFSRLGRKKTPSATYDPARERPMIRASICTGERVAGFVEQATGHFREVMLLRSDADLERFRKQYGIREEIGTIY